MFTIKKIVIFIKKLFPACRLHGNLVIKSHSVMNIKTRTMGLFISLGLMQRTKDGSQLKSIFINTSKDLLNCALNVGDRFLVSSPYKTNQKETN